MLTVLLTILHVLVCVFMVVVVLLQSGKAADLAGAFGGMGSQTTFGPRGTATALSKATAVAAVLFMVTSMSLAILATRGRGATGTSILDSQHPAPLSTVPVKPRGPAGSVSGAPVGAPTQPKK
jgi:preprotein translocase subunit SecG